MCCGASRMVLVYSVICYTFGLMAPRSSSNQAEKQMKKLTCFMFFYKHCRQKPEMKLYEKAQQTYSSLHKSIVLWDGQSKHSCLSLLMTFTGSPLHFRAKPSSSEQRALWIEEGAWRVSATIQLTRRQQADTYPWWLVATATAAMHQTFQKAQWCSRNLPWMHLFKSIFFCGVPCDPALLTVHGSIVCRAVR